MSNVNANIFKAYDIRGLCPEEINEEAVCRIGLAFADFLSEKWVVANRQMVVGRDARLSSDNLFRVLAAAANSRGFEIIDIGRVSTPCFYWALINEKAAGGAMITASHNPAGYNGLKLCGPAALPISRDSGLAEIKAMVQTLSVLPVLAPGRIIRKNVVGDYLRFLKSKIDLTSLAPLKIVIDAGNGMIGPEAREFFKGSPIEAEILFGEPDGNFPHHEANPLKEENLVALKKTVLEKNADLGAAFDGDGDRVGFIDEQGRVARGDFITALIARELLRSNPRRKIFYEIRSSRTVPETIAAAGGEPVLGQAGHSLIKAQMRREDILFGGELSGHYFFKDLGFIDNAWLALLLMIKILDREKKSFSSIIAPLSKYYHSGEINFWVDNAERVIDGVVEKFRNGQIKRIDGVTVEYPDWWFNLRQSNTEPLIRLNLEAATAKLLEEKEKELRILIEA